MSESVPPGTGKPVHSIVAEPVQYRLKVQRFSRAAPELTVRAIDFSPEIERAHAAFRRDVELRPWNKGGEVLPFPKRKPARRLDADGAALQSKPEDRRRAELRAKSRLRLAVRELAPSGLLTMTKRGGFKGLEAAYGAWALFLRGVRAAYPEFEAVVVPEPHASGALHLHAAIRLPHGCTFSVLRRLWHGAILRSEGVDPRSARVPRRGSDAPGNVDYRRSVSHGDPARRSARIARYLSKYLAKGMVHEFGRRSFSRTQGIAVADAQVYWLRALDLNEALRESLALMSLPERLEARAFRPDRGGVAFLAVPEPG